MFAIVVVLAMLVSSQEVEAVAVIPVEDANVATLRVEDVGVAAVNPLENVEVATTREVS